MSRKINYFRFSYDSEEALNSMITEGSLRQPMIRLSGGTYDPKKCIEQTVKIGDGILLARFDIDESAGEVVAIGIVQNEKPATKVLWKPIRFKLFPNPQGGVAQWKKEVCFKFNEQPAKRYKLAEIFAKHFP
jgi:hypothetical protein